MKTVKRKDDFPSWAIYIAKDVDGEKYFFANKPVIVGEQRDFWDEFFGELQFYKQGKPTNSPEKKIWKIVD